MNDLQREMLFGALGGLLIGAGTVLILFALFGHCSFGA